MSDEAETKTLYGDGHGRLPIEVAKVERPAFNFAAGSSKPLDGASRRYRFGVDHEQMATQLRILADMLDAGDALPQSVFQVTKATLDDFVRHWVTLEFATRADPVEAAR